MACGAIQKYNVKCGSLTVSNWIGILSAFILLGTMVFSVFGGAQFQTDMDFIEELTDGSLMERVDVLDADGKLTGEWEWKLQKESVNIDKILTVGEKIDVTTGEKIDIEKHVTMNSDAFYLNEQGETETITYTDKDGNECTRTKTNWDHFRAKFDGIHNRYAANEDLLEHTGNGKGSSTYLDKLLEQMEPWSNATNEILGYVTGGLGAISGALCSKKEKDEVKEKLAEEQVAEGKTPALANAQKALNGRSRIQDDLNALKNDYEAVDDSNAANMFVMFSKKELDEKEEKLRLLRQNWVMNIIIFGLALLYTVAGIALYHHGGLEGFGENNAVFSTMISSGCVFMGIYVTAVSAAHLGLFRNELEIKQEVEQRKKKTGIDDIEKIGNVAQRRVQRAIDHQNGKEHDSPESMTTTSSAGGVDELDLPRSQQPKLKQRMQIVNTKSSNTSSQPNNIVSLDDVVINKPTAKTISNPQDSSDSDETTQDANTKPRAIVRRPSARRSPTNLRKHILKNQQDKADSKGDSSTLGDRKNAFEKRQDEIKNMHKSQHIRRRLIRQRRPIDKLNRLMH